MICPSCNKEISVEAESCPHCMTSFKKNLTPFQKYDMVMKKHLSGAFVLALAIATTVFGVAALCNFIVTLTKSLLGAVLLSIPVIVSVFTTIAIWMVWAKARNGVVTVKENRGKLMCLSTFNCVMSYIICIATGIFGMLSIWLASKISKFTNSMIDFAESLGAEDAADMFEVLDIAADGAVVILFFIVAAVMAACIVFINRCKMLRKMMERISDGYARERIPCYYTSFYSISSYVFAVIFCIIAVIMRSSFLMCLESFAFAVMLALSGIIFELPKNEIREYYLEEQLEIQGEM